ncbi:MAG: Stp1/IreP family PP2C-type Ser/Thr phosphatase [Clostridia bacterium]|nr:Stp1/IreP family PP2C-type Ser/Thr phosphatase [Clostridia bacterium]
MIISAATDIGVYRESNQDAYSTGTFISGDAWAVVCDGMGGVSGGQIASRICIDVASSVIKRGYRANLSVKSAKNLLQSAINTANTAVFEESQKDPSLHGMGTTIVAVIVLRGIAVIGYVGDSRAYLITDTIKRLTKDHSLVQVMIDSGKLTEEEARVHPDRNIITRAVGIMNFVDVDYEITDFSGDDKILICTDGLNGSVDDDVIYDIATSDAENKSEELIKAAIESGSRDNITVVLLDSVVGGE